MNQNGSYSCSCEHGFLLMSDQRSCEGTSEHCCHAVFQFYTLQTSMSVKMTMAIVHKGVLILMDPMSVPVTMALR